MRVLLSLAFLLGAARLAAATTAADIPCSPASPAPDPCIITTAEVIAADSVLDFGARAVVVAPTGGLHGALRSGFDLTAAAITVQPGGEIRSQAGFLTLDASVGDIVVEAAQGSAVVDVSGDFPGSIDMLAEGNITIAGILSANPTVDLGGEGEILLDAGGNVSITASGRLTAIGARFGFGGEVMISAVGDVSHAGVISVAGAANGGLVIIDGFNFTSFAGSDVSVNSGAGGVQAEFEIFAENDVTIGGPIVGTAASSDELGSGAGALVSLTGLGTVAINAMIDVAAGGPFALGGQVEISGGLGVTQTQRILAEASGNGDGGLVSISANGPVSVDAIDATGTMHGGNVFVGSFDTVMVNDTISADGPGAVIRIDGCDVTIPTGKLVSSQGGGGANNLNAAGQLLVQGTVRATGGQNRFAYRDPTKPPIVTGSVTPAPVIVENPSIVQCGGPTTTTTTTTTTLPTTSTTSITTTSTTIVTIPPTTSTTAAATTSTSTAATTSTSLATTSTTAAASTSTTTSTLATTTTTTVASTTTTTVGSSTTTTSTIADSTTTTSVVPTTTTTTLLTPICTPADCDDADLCTLDSCDPDVGCSNVEVTSFDAATCRLSTIRSLLAAASDTDAGGPKVKRRLDTRARVAFDLVGAARGLTGPKQRARLRRSNKLLVAFLRTTEKGKQRGKIQTGLADQLINLARTAQLRLAVL